MIEYVYDIEANGLKATKIHCLSYCDVRDGIVKSETDYRRMREFFQQKDVVLIAHNQIRYDIPTVERILGIKVESKVIDTLAMSWYLDNQRKKHGLEVYGEEFGVPKPKIDDWEGLTSEEYVHRCEEDVKINLKLWNKLRDYLIILYGEEEDMWRIINYLNFKMDCLREQEELGLRLDVDHCQRMLDLLQKEEEIRTKELEAAMPKVPIRVKKKKPKIMYKKDGTLSNHGKEWTQMLLNNNFDPDSEEVEVISGYKEPNAGSFDQLKDWLYSLGWVPQHWKFVRNKKTGATSRVEQIGSKEEKGEVCDSVKELFDKEPKLEVLSGLSIIRHRISVFKGFLSEAENGRLYATAQGFTNTLRLQHSVIVNLPGLDKKFGRDIRGAILADERHVLCGSDLSGIEDVTKRHYIYKFDPGYVEEMNIPGFDPHLDIGVRADMISEEDSEFFKECERQIAVDLWRPNIEEKKRYQEIKFQRGKSKIVNFSSTYKIGAPSLARNSNMPESWAKKVLKVYWERNWAILEIEKECRVKTVGTDKWLQNPINKFWYSLRAEKDRFSTLNQGTAAYVFDIWITHMRELGLKIAMQYHDEVLLNVRKGQQHVVKNIINKAIQLTNDRLNLNVPIRCKVEFGPNYSECH